MKETLNQIKLIRNLYILNYLILYKREKRQVK